MKIKPVVGKKKEFYSLNNYAFDAGMAKKKKSESRLRVERLVE